MEFLWAYSDACKKKKKKPKHLESLKIYFRGSVLYVTFLLASLFYLWLSWNVTRFGLEPAGTKPFLIRGHSEHLVISFCFSQIVVN